MAPCTQHLLPHEYEMHAPVFGAKADAIMRGLNGMSVDELAAKVKISVPMARKLQQMAYEFPHKESGCKAIEAFTGVVFRAFGYGSLDTHARDRADNCIGIISSLYGWLKPDDVVKPYRLDFATALAPMGLPFTTYWREDVTECILKTLASNGSADLLNLLPGDAARSIDWKRVEAKARVWKVEFGEIQSGGKMRTPNSNRLKMLRGELLRQIVIQEIATPQQLMNLSSDSYVAEPSDTPGTLLFVTA